MALQRICDVIQLPFVWYRYTILQKIILISKARNDPTIW